MVSKLAVSLGARIALGFGVVVSLVALVAVGATMALLDAGRRADAASAAQAYVAALARVDGAAETYREAGDDAAADAVRAEIEAAREAARKAHDDASVDASSAAVERYGEAFETLVASDGDAAETVARINAAAQRLSASAASVVADQGVILEDGAKQIETSVAAIAQLETAQVSAAKLREEIRVVELGVARYATEPNPASKRELGMVVGPLPQTIVQLKRSAPTVAEAEAKTLASLETGLKTFVDAYKAWEQAKPADAEAAAKPLRQAAQTALRESAALYRNTGRAMTPERNRYRRLIEQGETARRTALAFSAMEAKVARLEAATVAFLKRPNDATYDAVAGRLEQLSAALAPPAGAQAEDKADADTTALAAEAESYGHRLGELREELAARDNAAREAAQTLGDASKAALALASTDMALLTREGLTMVYAIVAVGVSAVLLGAVAAFFIGRSISRPVRRITADARAIAGGALDTPIADAGRADEIGAIAEAVERFRENARRVEALEAERKASEAAAAAARREMMAGLQSAFGGVVDAVVAGDFARRVDASFADEELNALARGVNRLVETVGQGVAETARVMSRVADGDLSDRMHGAFEGAFAELKENVNATIARLSELIGALAETSAAVDANATTIADGSAELAEAATRQAASLEETAATMEEMSATIKNNADNAAAAKTQSDDASDRADRGSAIIDETVAAMSKIESSAGEIAQIVTVIDSIAFQTNLLALNAAVEAARAGEAGKGFAVVASEVRTLAQRSADAARDIRGQISQSGAHVEVGVRLVRETGAALTEIVEAIASVSQSVADISNASHEQALGVHDASSKLSELDTITQRNAAAAELSASNARHLKEDAERLRQLIGLFERDEDPEAAAA